MNSIKSLPGKGGRLHFISLQTYLFIFLTLIVVFLHQSAFTAQAQSILTAEQLGKIKAESGFAGLLERANSAGKAHIIVGLDTSFTPIGVLSNSQAVAQEQRIASTQNTFLSQLSSLNVTNIKQFRFIPYVALTVDGTALQAILASPTVQTVEEDVPVPPTLDLSVPRIGGHTAWARGYTGNGQTVAILDTGVDKTHAFLTGKVISEACYSTTDATPSQSVCPGGVTESTATGSAMPL